MLPLALSIFWFLSIAILLARAIRQSYLYKSIPAEHLPQADSPNLTVVIPARNEEKNIPRCLASLTAQSYPKEKLSIVVVDDNSTDRTSALVQELAQSDPRIHLIPGASLPTDWAGKPHACWQGAQDARNPLTALKAPHVHAALCSQSSAPSAGQSAIPWLCFLDADTTASPALLTSALRAAQQRNLAMLSLEPHQELKTFWERLLIPAGMLLLAFTQDISAINDPKNPHAAANGQFILIRRDVYEELQGHSHSSVRSAICEDTALARLVKSHNYSIALLGAEKLITTRMYTNFRSLWQGISKNATEMLRGLTATTLCALLGYYLAAASVVIPLIAIHHPIALIIACLATLALCLTHIFTNRHFQIPPLLGVLFPLAYLVGSTLLLNAVKMRLRGTVQWKDRTYAAPASVNNGAAPASTSATATQGWTQSLP